MKRLTIRKINLYLGIFFDKINHVQQLIVLGWIGAFIALGIIITILIVFFP